MKSRFSFEKHQEVGKELGDPRSPTHAYNRNLQRIP